MSRGGLFSIALLAMATGCGDRTGPGGLLGEAPGGFDASVVVPVVPVVPIASGSSSGGSGDGQECPVGQSRCEGVCVDLQSDANNCGTCTTTCHGGATCQAGSCACPGTEARCNDVCVDEQGDAKNCGQCGKACSGTTPFCSKGACVAPPPGCDPGGAGLTDCGPSATESCCTSDDVVGGTFFRTYDETATASGVLAPDGGPSNEADPATVSSFRLDRYLVTVGRFRPFVSAWKGGYVPPPGSGKHTHVNGGNGLSAAGGGYEPGWIASDNASVAPTDENLTNGDHCDGDGSWTVFPGSQESLPINCVTWQEAYAYCIWDGGFLPSEAEWEYTAAGGSEQRLYPWGSTDPGTNNEYAIEWNQYPSNVGAADSVTNLAPVGTATLGAGRWGQLNLQGDLWEWNLDYFFDYQNPWTDAAYLTSTSAGRIIRGGSDAWDGGRLASQARYDAVPTGRWRIIGFRCARTP